MSKVKRLPAPAVRARLRVIILSVLPTDQHLSDFLQHLAPAKRKHLNCISLLLTFTKTKLGFLKAKSNYNFSQFSFL